MAALWIRVMPAARSDAIVGGQGDLLRVSVRAPAEGNRANDAVLRLLAEQLGIDQSRFRIAYGRTSRRKLVAIEGMTDEELKERLRHLAMTAKKERRIPPRIRKKKLGRL